VICGHSLVGILVLVICCHSLVGILVLAICRHSLADVTIVVVGHHCRIDMLVAVFGHHRGIDILVIVVGHRCRVNALRCREATVLPRCSERQGTAGTPCGGRRHRVGPHLRQHSQPARPGSPVAAPAGLERPRVLQQHAGRARSAALPRVAGVG